MATCQKCKREVFQESKFCILHLPKEPHTILSEEDKNQFQLELMDFFIRKYVDRLEGKRSKEDYLNYFLQKRSNVGQKLGKILQEDTITIFDVSFPAYNEDETHSVQFIFQRLFFVHFENCTFASRVRLPKNATFDKCNFYSNWATSINGATQRNNIIYQDCTFHKKVFVNTIQSEFPLFNYCNFKEELNLSSTSFPKKFTIFVKNSNRKNEIKKMVMSEITSDVPIEITNVSIIELTIENSKFEQKFSVNNAIVNNFIIKNAIHQGAVLIDNNCKIGAFTMKDSIAHEFFKVDSCTFGHTDDEKLPAGTLFDNVIFHHFVSFTNTLFDSGLNFASSLFFQPGLFSNIKIDFNNTNRETYRIIKTALDKSGNFIDANDYYTLELNKYAEELKLKKPKGWRRISSLLWLYKYSSAYGQDFVRPFLWLLFFVGIKYLSFSFLEHRILFYTMFDIIGVLEYFVIPANIFAKTLTPVRSYLETGHEFLSLLFYLIFSILIWSMILAIKRKTKR